MYVSTTAVNEQRHGGLPGGAVTVGRLQECGGTPSVPRLLHPGLVLPVLGSCQW